jgi:hypothetical protein
MLICNRSHNFDKLKMDRRATKLSKKKTYAQALAFQGALSNLDNMDTLLHSNSFYCSQGKRKISWNVPKIFWN